jgi:hypothetical protein
LTHRPNDFPGYSHQSNPQGYGYLPSAPMVPIVPQGSTYARGWVNIKNEIKQATDGIKEEFNRNLQSLTEQMAHLIQNPRTAPVQQHESGAYNSGVWCSLPGCIDRAGHPAQFSYLITTTILGAAESVSTTAASSSSACKTCTKALSATASCQSS